ncbi:uncharacterized protein At2g33490-like isoform X2 [Prosopis cineraria]|uniref:uncharacterized protein At2g33490-like isoform X2 n=1 Tax=Prosopis cineraria TaxID=364024 RepID=UPI0024102B89|nr:uncharacterized protein At2g33490-like isoform X2 [Prosopis cineraria]XP_054806963.1 uncharacterized protein At2g33490-like isoform X2 [Prosopis cineraria]
MRNSLKKLRGLGLHKHHHHHHLHHDSKGRRDVRSLAQLDELDQATQDMQDMRDCYDSLLSAAAATANSAYEFSESLREMGSCLLQKTALNDDEESGRVLLMLGKLQFKLQKLVDNYRGHIIKTITTPSESLMNELQIVEEMKRQCDEKRDVYKHMFTRYKERGKSRAAKAESFTVQQLQTAHDEYDDEATLFVFRLKSLKQGQSRSLLTQAARHHAAQLHFFKKALQSLETVEPHVKSVTEQQHIDYPFSGLEDDDGDDGDDGEDDDESYDENDDGELSLDYGQNEQDRDVSTPQKSKEEKLDMLNRNSISFRFRTESQSAPLFIDKPDFSEKLRQMQPSLSRKFSSYVLPTPVNAKSSISSGSSNLATSKTHINLNEPTKNLWHSSPLEQKKYGENFGDEEFSRSTVTNAQSVLKESNGNVASTRLPLPLVDGLLSSTHDAFHVHSKKIKRHAFSGPLTGKPWPTKHASVESIRLFSGPLLQTPTAQPPSSSPKISPSASPTFTSSPKISELHELPRPPAGFSSNSSRLVGLVGHSGPLVSRGPKLSAANKLVTSTKNAASPLPTPPQAMSRSFSIPSSGARAEALHDPRPVESPNRSSVSEDLASLPPLALTSSQLSSDGSETVAQAV